MKITLLSFNLVNYFKIKVIKVLKAVDKTQRKSYRIYHPYKGYNNRRILMDKRVLDNLKVLVFRFVPLDSLNKKVRTLHSVNINLINLQVILQR